MMVCCHCNAGRRSCVCAKANKPCTNCLPARKGHCSNTKLALAPPDLAHLQTALPPLTTNPASPVTSASLTTSLPLSTVPIPSLDLVGPPAVVTPPGVAQSNELTTSSTFPFHAPRLPSPSPLAAFCFSWGEYDAESFSHSLTALYMEVVKWRPNFFVVPLGNSSKKFVLELSRLFRAYAEGSTLESVAQRAITVMSILLLQKPAYNSKPKDHFACLEHCLHTWQAGGINNLVLEGRCLQKCFPKISSQNKHKQNLVHSSSNLMFKGKVSAALDLLAQKGKGGVLHTRNLANQDDPSSPTVLDVLKSKHPPPQPATTDALTHDSLNPLRYTLSFMATLTPSPSALQPSTSGVPQDPRALMHIAGDVSVPPSILPPGSCATPLPFSPEDSVCPSWTPTGSLPFLPAA